MEYFAYGCLVLLNFFIVRRCFRKASQDCYRAWQDGVLEGYGAAIGAEQCWRGVKELERQGFDPNRASAYLRAGARNLDYSRN